MVWVLCLRITGLLPAQNKKNQPGQLPALAGFGKGVPALQSAQQFCFLGTKFINRKNAFLL